jgi:hypothetical protein
MPRRRRLKTKEGRMRDRARFWVEHAETVRLFYVGGGMVVVAAAIASIALR